MKQNLRIESDGGITTVFLDGVEVQGIYSVSFRHKVGDLPQLRLHIQPVFGSDSPAPFPRIDEKP